MYENPIWTKHIKYPADFYILALDNSTGIANVIKWRELQVKLGSYEHTLFILS